VTTLLIARHAAHDWLGRGFAGRRPEVALNAQGRQEAEALVGRLAGVPLAAIYCSPQPRTQQTAAPLVRARGIDIRIDGAFDEVDLGDWEGRTFDEVRDQPAWQHWLAHRGSGQPPGGERFTEVARRASEGLRRLVEAHPDQQVLVVSHGDVIKAMIAGVLALSLDNLERFDIAPCSVSVIAMGPERAQLRLLNALGALGTLGAL
jgi:broad specificity phosphatase PhoE